MKSKVMIKSTSEVSPQKVASEIPAGTYFEARVPAGMNARLFGKTYGGIIFSVANPLKTWSDPDTRFYDYQEVDINVTYNVKKD